MFRAEIANQDTLDAVLRYLELTAGVPQPESPCPVHSQSTQVVVEATGLDNESESQLRV